MGYAYQPSLEINQFQPCVTDFHQTILKENIEENKKAAPFRTAFLFSFLNVIVSAPALFFGFVRYPSLQITGKRRWLQIPYQY